MAEAVARKSLGQPFATRDQPQEWTSTNAVSHLSSRKIGIDACAYKPHQGCVIGFIFRYPEEEGKRECGAVRYAPKPRLPPQL